MCASYGNLSEEVLALKEAGADILHLDVMDGRYVPNFGMGLQDIEYICKAAEMPCDVHLMIENPGQYVEKFIALGAKIVYIHPNAEYHPLRTLQLIRSLGAKSGIAVNPGTAVSSVEPLLDHCDYVLAMGVNPGFAGQKYVENVTETLKELAALKQKYAFTLMLDGACSEERVREMHKIGVDGFVLGTSALFGKSEGYQEILSRMRRENEE